MKGFCECERPSGGCCAATNRNSAKSTARTEENETKCRRRGISSNSCGTGVEEERKSDETRSSLQHPVYCDLVGNRSYRCLLGLQHTVRSFRELSALILISVGNKQDNKEIKVLDFAVTKNSNSLGE